MRRTKIVCTIGPATSKRGVMERLLRAGMDVARLNFSHGTHEEHAQVIANLRELAAKQNRPLAILQDLSGPKVRLGRFAAPFLTLKRGQEVAFLPTGELTGSELSDGTLCGHAFDPAHCTLLPLPVPELLSSLKPGNTLLLDDGKITLRVTRCEGALATGDRVVWARCQVGGEIKQLKGVTAPKVVFDVPTVTEKDLADLRFGLEHGVDWVAASYVRTAEDLLPLKAVMREAGRHVLLIAKIEKSEAVRNLDSILENVDGIMVARGDLGVEMPFDEVPIVQKYIIRRSNRAGKPVITATQMLESMMQNSRPTRAEATDVANAILDGTDAVMLSGETAAGQYPIEAVQTLVKIALRAEDAFFKEQTFGSRLSPPSTVTEVVARATAGMADALNATAILCATTSGGTARMVARYRPHVPILGATTHKDTYHQLALTWGVIPHFIGPVRDTDSMMLSTIEAAQKVKLVKDGDRVVLTAGVPVNNPGTTNLIKVHTVGKDLDPHELASS